MYYKYTNKFLQFQLVYHLFYTIGNPTREFVVEGSFGAHPLE